MSVSYIDEDDRLLMSSYGILLCVQTESKKISLLKLYKLVDSDKEEYINVNMPPDIDKDEDIYGILMYNKNLIIQTNTKLVLMSLEDETKPKRVGKLITPADILIVRCLPSWNKRSNIGGILVLTK